MQVSLLQSCLKTRKLKTRYIHVNTLRTFLSLHQKKLRILFGVLIKKTLFVVNKCNNQIQFSSFRVLKTLL